MELFYILLVLLLATRVLGELAVRLGQPQLVGELVAGIVLGIVAQQFTGRLPTLAALPQNEVFDAVTKLAIFFLMLVAGVEMRPKELAKSSGVALPIAIGGIALPLALGFGLAWAWLPQSDALFAQAAVVGLTLAITAVPVSVTVLIELGALNTKTGNVIVGAAVFDDVLSLLLLAVILSVAIQGEALSIGALALLAGKVAVFFAVTVALGHFVLPRAGRLIRRLKLERADISLLIIWGLFAAVLSEYLELHYVVGAFTAGLLFRRRTIDEENYKKLRDQLEALTFGFLAPLFFASIGLQMDIDALMEVPMFVAALVVAAFAGKFLGAGLVARLCGLGKTESFAVGAGMNARGAVALIVADVARAAGVFEPTAVLAPAVTNLFSALVITAIATTVVSPVLLRQAVGTGRIR